MSETQVFGKVRIERLTQYSRTDLDDLCEATESAIVEGGGFGWLTPPARQVLENYWKGVLLVPERRLVVGRLDGVVAGSAQLSRAPRNNEAQAFACPMTSSSLRGAERRSNPHRRSAPRRRLLRCARNDGEELAE